MWPNQQQSHHLTYSLPRTIAQYSLDQPSSQQQRPGQYGQQQVFNDAYGPLDGRAQPHFAGYYSSLREDYWSGQDSDYGYGYGSGFHGQNQSVYPTTFADYAYQQQGSYRQNQQYAPYSTYEPHYPYSQYGSDDRVHNTLTQYAHSVNTAPDHHLNPAAAPYQHLHYTSKYAQTGPDIKADRRQYDRTDICATDKAYSSEDPGRSERLAQIVRQPHPKAGKKGSRNLQSAVQHVTSEAISEYASRLSQQLPSAFATKQFYPNDTGSSNRTASSPAFHQPAPRPSKSPNKHVLPRPKPTRSYLERSNKRPLPAEAPRPLLIVLDLNGTLLYRKGRGTTFVGRTNVSKFLPYLLANHKLLIWSSARPENVEIMCSKLLNDKQLKQLIGIWGRDKLHLTPEQYNDKVQVYKQLSWVWNDDTIKASVSELSDAWTPANTVLIDDSVEKAASEPYNLLQIEEFEARPDQLNVDVLGQVVRYLEMLKSEKDVSAYMRLHPFIYDESAPAFDWSTVLP